MRPNGRLVTHRLWSSSNHEVKTIDEITKLTTLLTKHRPPYFARATNGTASRLENPSPLIAKHQNYLPQPRFPIPKNEGRKRRSLSTEAVRIMTRGGKMERNRQQSPREEQHLQIIAIIKHVYRSRRENDTQHRRRVGFVEQILQRQCALRIQQRCLHTREALPPPNQARMYFLSCSYRPLALPNL